MDTLLSNFIRPLQGEAIATVRRDPVTSLPLLDSEVCTPCPLVSKPTQCCFLVSPLLDSEVRLSSTLHHCSSSQLTVALEFLPLLDSEIRSFFTLHHRSSSQFTVALEDMAMRYMSIHWRFYVASDQLNACFCHANVEDQA